MLSGAALGGTDSNKHSLGLKKLKHVSGSLLRLRGRRLLRVDPKHAPVSPESGQLSPVPRRPGHQLRRHPAGLGSAAAQTRRRRPALAAGEQEQDIFSLWPTSRPPYVHSQS